MTMPATSLVVLRVPGLKLVHETMLSTSCFLMRVRFPSLVQRVCLMLFLPAGGVPMRFLVFVGRH